jgi:hypothetical protein
MQWLTTPSVLLDINLLKEPEKLDEWDQLVLPDGHRQMVQAMVETYAKGSHDSSSTSKAQYANPGMDIVRGKGMCKYLKKKKTYFDSPRR